MSVTAILVVLSASAMPSPGDRYATPLGISLLEARVADVEKRMGEAPPRAGDAFLCYIAPKKNVMIRFLVEGVGMPGRRVVAFNMRELDGFAAPGCGVFDEKREAALDLVVGGLALGMGRDDVLRLIEPEYETGNRAGRHFVGNRPMRDRPYFGRDVVLTARFSGRRLTELDVSSAARPLSTPIPH